MDVVGLGTDVSAIREAVVCKGILGKELVGKFSLISAAVVVARMDRGQQRTNFVKVLNAHTMCTQETEKK